MLLVGDEAGVLATQDAIQAIENSLIGEPVAARGQSIFIFAILLVGFRIPRAAADALDQFRADAIALDRQRMIGVGDVAVLYALEIGAGPGGGGNRSRTTLRISCHIRRIRPA